MKTFVYWCCCSVTQLCLILQPHGLEHTRLPCPSLYPRLCSNSCPLSRWCYLTILSSATHCSFCLQCFPASGSFPKSRLFTLGNYQCAPHGGSSLAPWSSWHFPTGVASAWYKRHFPSKMAQSCPGEGSLWEVVSAESSPGWEGYGPMMWGRVTWARGRKGRACCTALWRFW